MNLLLTGAWGGALDYVSELTERGHVVSFMQFERDELPCSAGWVEGIVANDLFASHPVESFSNLRYVQLTSAGFDRVPMDYMREHNVEVHNARGVYSIPMAEFVLASVLQLYKQMPLFGRSQERHSWLKRRNLPELNGKTVCIVGCGSVGAECAKRFNAFGCKVVGVNSSQKKDSQYGRIVGVDHLDEELSRADIVILALPLTQETFHLMNAARLKVMKQGAILVNIARGALVDTDALIWEMKRLGGAVLDVFEEEPLASDSLLWDMEKVIVTPHNSFESESNRERLSNVIMSNLEKVVATEAEVWQR